jgi:hypothetical protein
MAKAKAKPISKEELRFSPLLPAEDSTTGRDYTVRAKVWRWKGGTWHFITLPKNQSAEIRRRFGSTARGWGSIRVRIKVGDTEWQTSLFPTNKNTEYLFAIKANVRKVEDIGEGDRVTALVHIL